MKRNPLTAKRAAPRPKPVDAALLLAYRVHHWTAETRAAVRDVLGRTAAARASRAAR